MKKITKDGLIELTVDQGAKIHELILSHNKDYHYLAFDRQLGGFSPLGAFLLDDGDIPEREVINSIIESQEVCSLYPRLKLTLYPFTKLDDGEYNIDLTNIDKHFEDILYLNDKVYKTHHLYVDCGHGPQNFDEQLLIEKLFKLLEKSHLLEDIYFEKVF